jgi:hypothetical protein
VEEKTRKHDWIMVVRGRRQAMTEPEILFEEATGPRTRSKYRFRLSGSNSTGRLKWRRIDEAYWLEEGERSVSEGGWSELVASVEAELRERRNVEGVTPTHM